MEFECGFDMLPPLLPRAEDQGRWGRFIWEIWREYRYDSEVDFKTNFIEFKKGDRPKLPLACNKFLSFRSKMSGMSGIMVEGLVSDITERAQSHFGDRIRAWNEQKGKGCYFHWTEVNMSVAAFEKGSNVAKKVEASEATAPTQDIRKNAFEKDSNPPFYEIRPLPGRGQGLIARSPILKGAHILSEKPLFTIPIEIPLPRILFVPPDMLPQAKQILLEKTLANKLRSLSESQQHQYLSLNSNHPGFDARYPFTHILESNALRCGPNSKTRAIYPIICLLNHSDTPNAHANWDTTTNHETIHATRDIPAGEEITIDYTTTPSLPTTQTAHIQTSLNITHPRSLYSYPLLNLRVDDRRRIRIQRLEVVLNNDLLISTAPESCFLMCGHLYHLLKREVLDASAVGFQIPRVFAELAVICITHGDRARASVCARRALTGGDWLGVDVGRMKGMVEKPGEDREFGRWSRKWETGVEEMLKWGGQGAPGSWLWERRGYEWADFVRVRRGLYESGWACVRDLGMGGEMILVRDEMVKEEERIEEEFVLDEHLEILYR